MGKLKVSDEMENRLIALPGPLEIVNASGQVLSQFILAEGIEPMFQPLTEEEIRPA